MEIYIILVNYNSCNCTIECINSLEKTNEDIQIIIVDNASSDNSYQELMKNISKYNNCIILESENNVGFAGGNNIGIKYALEHGAEYLLLLNNDTEVEPDFLKQLLIDYKGNTIRSPKINYYDYPDESWYEAGEFDQNKCIVKNKKSDKRCNVTFASGCCMLISKKIIDTIGFLDEEYFMYYEDVDYCLKAMKEGIKIEYVPESVIYHKVGKSSGGSKSNLSVYYTNRNRFYIIHKYKLGIMCKAYTVITRIARIGIALIKKNNDLKIIEAYKDYRKKVKGKKEFY